jgi:hypothetical protein
MIGDGLEIGAVLAGRVPTGEIYSPQLKQQYPNRDWILTRILWLDGIEVHNKNTKARYIYIHVNTASLLAFRRSKASFGKYCINLVMVAL